MRPNASLLTRLAAALILPLLLSPILALDGTPPRTCTIPPFALAVQGASPQESWMPSHRRLPRFSERVLARLEQSKLNEPNAHLRDDVHIAYLIVLYSARGDATYCTAHELASYTALQLHPDAVWPWVVATRRAKLGALYDALYDENGLCWKQESAVPKKPARREIAAVKAA